MLNVPDPDSVIAERLGGKAPFVTTDPFSDSSLALEAIGLVPAGVGADPAAAPPAAAVDERPAVRPPPAQSAAVPEQPPAAKAPAAKAPGAKPPAPKQPPAARTRSLGPMEIDLTRVLEEFTETAASHLTPAPPGKELGEVFQDFRDEVDRQSGTDESAQHMTLAATYLEMGMEEDAIQSLKQAARSPRLRFEAGQQLAGLFKKRTDLAQAVEWLERAAEAPAPSAEAGLALLYDLGSTLEAMGETARALAVFMELQADAGEYRDVAARVERLARAQTGG
jgi:tetratricopeptide (TPR) repeat protein